MPKDYQFPKDLIKYRIACRKLPKEIRDVQKQGRSITERLVRGRIEYIKGIQIDMARTGEVARRKDAEREARDFIRGYRSL